MGFLDDMKAKAQGLLHEHGDKVNDAATKAGAVVNDKTGGKYADKINQAQDFVKGQTAVDGAPDSTPPEATSSPSAVTPPPPPASPTATPPPPATPPRD